MFRARIEKCEAFGLLLRLSPEAVFISSNKVTKVCMGRGHSCVVICSRESIPDRQEKQCLERSSRTFLKALHRGHAVAALPPAPGGLTPWIARVHVKCVPL